MPAPHEVVAAPLTVWIAPVGTSFPNVWQDTPGGGWVRLGTEGSKNYSDAGVSVGHTEEVTDFIPAGSTMPTKRFRVGESMMITLELVDIGPDAYAKVMNDSQITTVAKSAGTVAGNKSFSLYRGDQVKSYAVVLRGVSSVDNDLNLQYEFTQAGVSVNGEAVFNKGEPVMLPTEISVQRPTENDTMKVRIQTTTLT